MRKESEISAERRCSSEESGKNMKRLFLFLVSQPPPPLPLSAEVSTHKRFMKQPRGDCSRGSLESGEGEEND